MGCLALLQQRAAPAPNCTASDAEVIMRALLLVNVQSLTVGDRRLCLQLFASLIKVSSWKASRAIIQFILLNCRTVPKGHTQQVL